VIVFPLDRVTIEENVVRIRRNATGKLVIGGEDPGIDDGDGRPAAGIPADPCGCRAMEARAA
jgi:hypothetical protein